jgi:excisionase family DNA binding protein
MKLQTVAETASQLRVSQQLIYQAIAEGRLKCLRLSGAGKRGTIRIRESDVEEFLAESEVQELEPELD